MDELKFKDLAFKAGFTGSDLSNTQFGTSYEHALKNFAELIIAECEKVVDSRFEPDEPWMRPGTLSEHFGFYYEESY